MPPNSVSISTVPAEFTTRYISVPYTVCDWLRRLYPPTASTASAAGVCVAWQLASLLCLFSSFDFFSFSHPPLPHLLFSSFICPSRIHTPSTLLTSLHSFDPSDLSLPLPFLHTPLPLCLPLRISYRPAGPFLHANIRACLHISIMAFPPHAGLPANIGQWSFCRPPIHPSSLHLYGF